MCFLWKIDILCYRFLEGGKKVPREGVKRVLRYLKGTVNVGLMYEKGADFPVHGYSDASHGDDVDTRKGRAGYVFLSAGAAVSWKAVV